MNAPVKAKLNTKLIMKAVVAALLALAILLASWGVYTLAEYVKSSKSKRVLSARGDEGAAFSSNYLVTNNDPTQNVYKRLIYASAAGISASGDVTVCNYPQGNMAAVYEEDITYTFTARLVMLSESGGVYVKTNAATSDVGEHYVDIRFKGGTPVRLNAATLSYDFGTSTLDHHSSVTDIVSLEFDSDFANAGSLCLYLSAVPSGSQPGVTTLDAVFSVALNTGDTQNGWDGEFTDDSTAGDPAQPDFDGFNYVISGTGTGTVTLTWNNEKLQISQVFLAKNSLTPTVSGTSTSVTIPVNSDLINRYDLQFYYADETVTFENWAALTGCVTLTYTNS